MENKTFEIQLRQNDLIRIEYEGHTFIVSRDTATNENLIMTKIN